MTDSAPSCPRGRLPAGLRCLVFHRRRPDHVAELLTWAGLSMRATILREPEDYRGGVEKTQQAYLLARKP